MKNPSTHDERFAKMTFASVYPLYLTKVEKKGRTKRGIGSGYTMVDGLR
jgi:hypothetical protein